MDSFQLKILACIFMFVDHVSFILLNNNIFGRIVGRLAFPIFAYLIATNFSRTSNKEKYFIRLLIFAFLSQLPFHFLIHGLNIFFTLCLGFLCCYYWQEGFEKLFNLLCFSFVLLLSFFLHVDYGFYGVALVFLFYIFRNSFLKQFISLLILDIIFYVYMPLEMFGILAFIPLYFYNNRKGKSLKYVFYVFYPIHLFLIFLVFRFFK